jgi:hypothetical protein
VNDVGAREAILLLLLRSGIHGADESYLEDELGDEFPGFDEELRGLVTSGRVEADGCSWYRLPVDDWAMRAADLAHGRSTLETAEAIAALLRGEL